jgi:predicted Ser/Thr protein kinase
MTPERWAQIKEVFGAVLETPESNRREFLESRCGEDAELRAEVQRMLKGNDQGSFESPTVTLFPAAAELATGDCIAQYRVEARLGEGGMGVVYRAHDTRLDRDVALKVLPPERSSDAEGRRRLIQEARAASALNHPNIVTIYEVGFERGVDFIAMEYVEGQVLAQAIPKGGLPAARAIDYAMGIASALGKAHAAGVIHRDLKPANVMLTVDGRVKLLDFGIAQRAASDGVPTSLTAEGQISGTIGYMSPEQIRGLPADRRSDLFSLGVVLYQMVTQEHPFAGDSAAATSNAILQQPPRDFGQAVVPPKLKAIIRKLLEKDPANRHQSAGEVHKELEDLKTSLAPARPLGLVFAIAAAAMLLMVALGVWYAAREHRAQWARNVAIPQIERLIAADDYLAALDLAREAEKHIPNDVKLGQLWPQMSQVLSFETDPPGAEVFFKKYAAPESEWRRLRITPMAKITVPLGFFEWKITKAGYEDLHVAARTPAERLQPPFLPSSSLQRITLDRKGSVPDGMVKVPGGTLRINISAFGLIGPFSLQDYFIDRYEVTNREFKRFVDRGGYRSRESWKEPFGKDGRKLAWEEAMNEFRDSTGQPGPSTWELGTYPDGEDDLPVSGVSWYEASAYAEFVQKKLPTMAHWYYAANLGNAPYVVPASNFSKKGPARVGQSPGIGASGTYDMAGNVKEWCSNESEDGLRFAQGGVERSLLSFC